MSDIETRVAVLEQHIDYHEKELARLDVVAQRLDLTLAAIQSQLNQIKWIAIGAASMLIVDKFGIVTAIKALL